MGLNPVSSAATVGPPGSGGTSSRVGSFGGAGIGGTSLPGVGTGSGIGGGFGTGAGGVGTGGVGAGTCAATIIGIERAAIAARAIRRMRDMVPPGSVG